MSIANYLTALDAQRDALARNLVAMGVQASETEKLFLVPLAEFLNGWTSAECVPLMPAFPFPL